MGSTLLCGELVGFKLNHSLGVESLIYSFTSCDYQIGHGDILVERTDQSSLMNCSLVTTS
jgi:hypothetical protein